MRRSCLGSVSALGSRSGQALPSLFVALITLTSAFARVTNITFPAGAVVGTTIKLNVHESGYIQNWDDLGILVGFGSPDQLKNCKTCVGATGQYYTNLYHNSTLLGNNTARPSNFDLVSPVPSGLNTSIPWRITAAVPYVVGASGLTSVQYFNRTIRIYRAPTGVAPSPAASSG